MCESLRVKLEISQLYLEKPFVEALQRRVLVISPMLILSFYTIFINKINISTTEGQSVVRKNALRKDFVKDILYYVYFLRISGFFVFIFKHVFWTRISSYPPLTSIQTLAIP